MASRFALASAHGRAKVSVLAKGSAARLAVRIVGCAPTWVWVLAGYIAIALLTIGRYAIAHLQTTCACVGYEDPPLAMWGLTWWPHAIAHGLNPFVSHYVWSPQGVNVAQGTFLPTAAGALAPLTVLFGPVLSYNVLAIGSPALAAFTAYLLCRRVTGRELPAIAGGYLFGFSSYEFAQLLGHINLALIFLMPLFVHVALRRVDGEISRRTYVIVLAVLLVLQAGLSTEILAEAVGFGAVVLGTAYLVTRHPQRSRIVRLIGETTCAGVFALAIGAPFFYYALFSGGFPRGAAPYWDVYALDLLNPLFPTGTTLLGHSVFQSLSNTYSGGGLVGEDGYLSIPVLGAFLFWGLRSERRRAMAQLVMTGAAVSFVAALGAHLHVDGHQVIALPFDWTKTLPIFNDIIPSRLIVFTTLAVALGVAVWLALPWGHASARWAVLAVGIVLILPNVTPSLYGTPLRNPRFFATSMYQRYLKPNETVLILPFSYNDVSDLWQAESGYYFYMPEGYTGQVVPTSFADQPVVSSLLQNVPPPAAELGTFIRQHAVSHVIVDQANAGSWRGVMAELGFHGREIGGVLLYSVPGAPALLGVRDAGSQGNAGA
jgi:hypothetical protein